MKLTNVFCITMVNQFSYALSKETHDNHFVDEKGIAKRMKKVFFEFFAFVKSMQLKPLKRDLFNKSVFDYNSFC